VATALQRPDERAADLRPLGQLRLREAERQAPLADPGCDVVALADARILDR
jgi:hypothetical protein